MLRQVRATGVEATAVVADAEFGDGTALRRALHTLGQPHALGASSHLTVFQGTLTTPPPRQAGRGPVAVRPRLASGGTAIGVRGLAVASPARAWRTVSWRNGTYAPWRARF